MIEEFRFVEGFENLYSVSNQGKIVKHAYKIDCIRSGKCITLKYKEHELQGSITSSGYVTVELTNKDGIETYHYLHRFVAEAFIPNPNNLPQVNHKDGNKQNNCVDNLEWVTSRENIQHSIVNNLGTGGGYKKKHHIMRLDTNYIYSSIGEVCKEFSVSYNTVYSHILRKTPLKGVILLDIGQYDDRKCSNIKHHKKYRNCNTGEVFKNRSEAARSIGVSDSAIYNAIKANKPCKGQIFEVLHL